ncbi:Hypothetical protein EAG7_03346 [Klebsiella aerogenes]|nr:Hypothetical protein EAG7_03346 [Klebsiella aerogenes]
MTRISSTNNTTIKQMTKNGLSHFLCNIFIGDNQDVQI